jgi:hypothetical protein
MGIQVSTNFDLASQVPLDSRIIVSNQSERNALATNNQAYAGMIVYVTGENKYYYYNTSNQWIEFNSSTVNNIVFTTGNQTISGVKLFSSGNGGYLKGDLIYTNSPANLRLSDDPGNIASLPLNISYLNSTSPFETLSANANTTGYRIFWNFTTNNQQELSRHIRTQMVTFQTGFSPIFGPWVTVAQNLQNSTGIVITGFPNVNVSARGIFSNYPLEDRLVHIEKNGVFSLLSGERMGIGIHNPSEKLHIVGNLRLDGRLQSTERPTVNGTGVLLSGEAAQLPSTIIYTIGNSYIIARPEDDIFTKYQEAKALNPNGNPKSTINRSSLIIFPGIYNLTGHLDINEEFTDIIGLGAIKKDVGCIPSVIITGSGTSPSSSGFIHVSANDVRIQGIYFSGDFNNFFLLGNALPKQVFEDCKGNNRSFSFVRPFQFPDPISIDGTFINCEGLEDSFTVPGVTHTFNGAYINCKAGDNSFSNSSNTQLNGLYRNCHAGARSFGAGGIGGNLLGTFENCQAPGSGFGFGGFPDLHGRFTNCKAGDQSFGFGGGGSFTGSFFENCKAGEASFGYSTFSLSGATFVNCTAGPASWGGIGVGDNNRMLGKLYNCRLTSGTFGILSGEGLLRNCIDGDNNIIDG